MPSLYETTTNPGDVSSSDFTTLYNASGLTVPNAGAGAVTGNLNVSGNLTVQGSSQLIGAVILGNTLTLPNYTFPLPDGSTDQVMVTDGNGNLSWVDVQSIPGAAYEIEATTTTGGANLTLLDSAGGQDSVKFASGTGIAVSRTDANTITITNTAPDTNTTYTINASATTGGANFNLVGSDSTTDTIKFAAGNNMTITRTDADTITFSTVADNIPDGTANGQMLVWENSAWTATNYVTWDGSSPTASPVFQVLNSQVPQRTSSAIRLYKNTTTVPFTTGDGTTQLFGLNSDTQSPVLFGSLGYMYSTTLADTEFRLTASNNNFGTNTATSITGGNTLVFSSAHGFTAGTQLFFVSPTQNGLTLNQLYYVRSAGLTTTQCQLSTTLSGSAVALTNGTGLTLTFFNQSKNPRLATVTQNGLALTGTNLVLNSSNTGGTASDAVITVARGESGSNATITWKESETRWRLNYDLIASGLQGGNVQVGITNDNEIYIGGQDLLIDTDGTHVVQSNSPIKTTAESMSINSDSTANDSYLYMKGSTEYLKWDDANTRFLLSDQLYISQANAAAILENRTTTGASEPVELHFANNLVLRVTDAANNNTDDGGPGIVFSRTSGTSGGTQTDYGVFGAVYNGTTNTANFTLAWSNDNFAESSPGVYPGTFTLQQWEPTNSYFRNNSLYIDYTTNGAAKVGVNTATPAYTLDVNGDAGVATDLTVGGDITVSGVKINLTTPVHQGQFLSVSDAVTPTITNSNIVRTSESSYRPTFIYDNSVAGPNSALFLRKNYGATPYTTGDGVNLAFQVDSDSQATNEIATVTATWDATAPIISLNTNINNNTTGPFVTAATFTTAQATLTGDLAVNGGDITTTQTTASVFDTTATTLNIGGAATTVNIGAYSSTETVNVPSLQVNSIATTRANTATTTSTAQFTVDSTTRQCLKMLIDVLDNVTGETHVVEVLAMKKGTTAYVTTYAEMYSNTALATFTADVSSGALRVRATPASANSTTFNFVRTSLA
mgnify:CR=1 FL=1